MAGKSPTTLRARDKVVPQVRRRVMALRVFKWLVHQAEAALVLYLALFAAFMAAVWFEIRFQPWTVVFWIINTLLLAGILFLVIKIILPLSMRNTNPLRVSADIEQRIPSLKQRLITAVELSQADESVLRNFSAGLVDLFYEDAGKTIRKSVKIRHLVPLRLIGLILLALGSVWFLNALPQFTARTAVDLGSLYVNTLLKPPFESNATLQVNPGDVIVLSGSDLEVKARLLGKEGDAVIRFHSEGFEPEEEEMEARGTAELLEYRYAFTSLGHPLYYEVEAGGLKSPQYAIRIAQPPTLETIQVTLRPPEYLDLKEERLPENQGHLTAHAGGTAAIQVTYNNAMETVTAEVQFAGDVENATSISLREAGGKWRGEFPVSATGTYTLSGTDKQGFESEPVTYNIDLTPDPAPEIEWVGPTDDTLYPLTQDPIPTSVDLAYEARDDSALARVYVAWRFEGDEERTRELIYETDEPRREVKTRYSWDYSELTYDENIFFRLEAYDRPYLITHDGEDLNPSEDDRFGSTTEKVLMLEPEKKLVVVEPKDEDEEEEEEDEEEKTIRRIARGGGPSDGETIAELSLGPQELEDKRLALAQVAEDLAREQEEISNAIDQLGDSIDNSDEEIQAKSLAGRQNQLTEKQSELSKEINLLADAIAAQNAPPGADIGTEGSEEAEAGEDEEETERTIDPEVDPEELRKFAHDLGKKAVFRTGNRITKRDVIGVLQEQATEALRKGDLERAKRDSFAAERKLHVIRQALKDPARAEEAEKKAEEEIEAYDLDKLNPVAVVLDPEARDGPEKKNSGGVFSGGPRLLKGEEEGTNDLEVDEVELRETEGINIVGSRSAEPVQEAAPVIENERYPAKYTGLVEEYLRRTGNF